MAESALPIFFLYGEPQRAANPYFVHVESLATRSLPNEWQIRPHQHADLNHIILIEKGGGTIFFDSEIFDFEAPRLLIVPARSIHGFTWKNNSEGVVLTIAEIQLIHLFDQYTDFRGMFEKPRCIAIEPKVSHELSTIMSSIGKELAWKGLGQIAAIHAGLLITFVQVMRQLQHATFADLHSIRQVGLVARYRQLVDQRFRLREPISVYARALGVSLTTLREACIVAGQAPSEIRDQRAILEAQRLLAYSALSITEVGEAIGILDPAYFSRFFARKCGQSPQSWRQKVKDMRHTLLR